MIKSIHLITIRRYFNKQCEQNGENDESCVDMDPVSVVNDVERGIIAVNPILVNTYYTSVDKMSLTKNIDICFQLNVASFNHGKTARGDTLSFDKSKTILPPYVTSSSRRHVGIKPDSLVPKFDDLRDDLDEDEYEDDVDDHKILKKKHRQDFR